MKILIFNTLYPPNIIGGAELSVKFLAEALVTLGHRITVISLSPHKGISIDTINGVKIYYVGLKNIYWPFNVSKNLSITRPIWHLIDICNPFMGKLAGKIIRIENPDIINTNNLSGFSIAVWLSSKKRKIPLVHTIRDHYLLCPRTTMYHKNRLCNSQCFECRWFSCFKKHKSSIVDGVVGISHYIADKHFESGYFKNAKIKIVIPNSYDVVQNLKRKNSKSIRFGYIGRLHPSKGIEKTLSAFNQLKTDDFKFFIAGRGTDEYEKTLHRKFKSPNFYFLGFVEPELFFSKIDILIVPSLWNEPFGRSVIEAFAHGIPVIGSNKGALPQLIDNGKTGFIYNTENHQDLFNIIKKIILNPALFKGKQSCALKKANCFLPDNIAYQYLNMYKKIVKA
jgi:glycosyltransferase involved in cell wall biosynthesis